MAKIKCGKTRPKDRPYKMLAGRSDHSPEWSWFFDRDDTLDTIVMTDDKTVDLYFSDGVVMNELEFVPGSPTRKRLDAILGQVINVTFEPWQGGHTNSSNNY